MFSIITPTYNAYDGLVQSAASVMSQMSSLFEYWVIDGGSSDETREWLRAQNNPRLHSISEPDSGVYDAMNKGIGLAKGNFLLFLGAGDLLEPGILSKAAERITHLPSGKLSFLYGNVRYRSENRVGDGSFSKHRLCTSNICHQGIFYEKQLFTKLGSYELKYRVYADWAFNLQCLGNPQVQTVYWDEVIADYEGGGLSDRVQDVPFAQNRLRLIQEHFGLHYAVGHWLRSQWQHRWEQLVTRQQNHSKHP
ncbi:MAG: glycosyltransferase family 2 protein [Chthoniobacterales bacterium]